METDAAYRNFKSDRSSLSLRRFRFPFCLAAVIVFQSNDIIFSEIASRLNFDERHRCCALAGDSMCAADRDVDRCPGFTVIRFTLYAGSSRRTSHVPHGVTSFGMRLLYLSAEEMTTQDNLSSLNFHRGTQFRDSRKSCGPALGEGRLSLVGRSFRS